MKKILIVSPHQDDEINIAGGLINRYKDEYDITVAYLTKGNFVNDEDVRKREAERALAKLGFDRKKGHIVNLGFDDCPYDATTHTYHSQKKKVVHSLRALVDELRPNIIIGPDLDYHPDHIMCSLCLETAIGEIIRDDRSYKPLVLKTFAYENSYNGPDDFYSGLDPKFALSKGDILSSNPYYKMSEAIYVSNPKRCNSYLLPINPLWKAILCHKSQILVGRAKRILNSGYYYWVRRTDSIMNDIEVSVSSGDKKLLSDFVLCDSSNILNGNIKPIYYDKGFWKPNEDDRDREVKLSLKKPIDKLELVIYPPRTQDNNNSYICINYGRKMKKKPLVFPYTHFSVDEKVSDITIKLCDAEGISEIEVFDCPIEGGSLSMLDIKQEKKKANKASLPMKVIDDTMICCHTLLQRMRRKAKNIAKTIHGSNCSKN